MLMLFEWSVSLTRASPRPASPRRSAVNAFGRLVSQALFVTTTGVSAGALGLLFGLTGLTVAPLAVRGSLGSGGA